MDAAKGFAVHRHPRSHATCRGEKLLVGSTDGEVFKVFSLLDRP